MSTPSLQSLPDGYRALVIGSTGAIGSAFLAHLQSDPRCALAVGLGRHTHPAVDLDDEATIAHAAQQLKAQGPWHCIIHAVGLLHGPQRIQPDVGIHRAMVMPVESNSSPLAVGRLWKAGLGLSSRRDCRANACTPSLPMWCCAQPAQTHTTATCRD